MPDTGASQSIVSVAIARDANLSIQTTSTVLRSASNGVMHLVGKAQVIMCKNKHSAISTVLVASDLNHSALIGWQDLQKLHVIPASFPEVAAVARCFQSLKNKTLSVFSSVFSDSLDNKPMCANNMKIYLKENSVPYRVSSPRPIPLRFQEPAHSEIAKHIGSGVIVPCNEPTDWCSLAFFVPKGDGKLVCLVTDYTKLNRFVVRPAHPFPSVPGIIQSIPVSAACFAKLDATHGYFQLPLDDSYSPAQLLFGRCQRTCLPLLPSQVQPINFQQAAISKDSAHDRSKLDHDHSKLSLSFLSAGQPVLLQDPKTSAWDHRGVVSSIRPADQLSYVIQVDNRFLIRPRRLLRPFPLDNCPPNIEVPAPISSSLPRRSERLQLRASSAATHTPTSVFSLFAISSNYPHQPQPCWDTARPSLSTSGSRSGLPSGRGPPLQLPLPHLPHQWFSRTTQTSQYITRSIRSPVTSTWTNPIMASPLSTSTGPASALAFHPSWQYLSPSSSSQDVATSTLGGNISHVPATRNSSGPSSLGLPRPSAPLTLPSPAPIPDLLRSFSIYSHTLQLQMNESSSSLLSFLPARR